MHVFPAAIRSEELAIRGELRQALMELALEWKEYQRRVDRRGITSIGSPSRVYRRQWRRL